jgi:hypothetical protein
MSISEHFRHRNDFFQSDIFVSDIGIADVNVGCRISPTLRSMLIPTYAFDVANKVVQSTGFQSRPWRCTIVKTT